SADSSVGHRVLVRCQNGDTMVLPGSAASCSFLSWVQGFSKKNFGFINNQTVCYPCGNYILFLDIKTKKTTALQCPTGQVGAFAVNASSEVLAFSDRKLNPLIYIYSFPELNKLTELKGNVQLDYTVLAFSFTGPYLASYSSIPEFVLSVWNWQENILLCSESQPAIPVTSLSFNPMNWQQLCSVNESSVTVWHIERNYDEHHLKRNPVKLPPGQGSLNLHEDLFFPDSGNEDPYHGPVMPVSAIAGLVGDEAETFMPRTAIKPPVHPTAHCWTATSDIYMGCKEGYILKIDAETLSACVLQQKPLPGKKEPDVLYFSAQEGVLFFYHIRGLQYEMKICADIVEPISSLLFSPDYTILLLITDQATAMACCPSSNSVAVGTKSGQIYFIDVTDVEAPRVVHRIFLSKFPVLSLHYDQSGQFLITRATEEHIFILDARPSKLFQVLGYIGNICNNINYIMFSLFVIFYIYFLNGGDFSSYLFLFSFFLDNEKFVNEQGMLNASAIKREQYDLDYPLSSAVRLKDNTAYGYCTCAPFICKYNLSEQEILAQKHCHSYQGGGIRSTVFSLDGKFILVNGETDGALVCLKWKYSFFSSCLFLSFNNIFVVCQVIREETERFADQKKELQMGIKKLRKTIQKMLHENEQVPDIEKLEQQEFNLDTEEQERVQAEAEQEVARVREKIEMETLANSYLQNVIKHECWDSMSVKGRTVKCFHIACEVKNYPLKELNEEELATLEKVLQLRKIEVQKKNLETESETVLSTEEGEKAEEVMAGDSPSCCLVGSLSSQYGGDTSVLYHQLDLHTREQKVNQIVLLKDIIYKVKTAFNEEFDIVARQKEQEIARVKERNLRIQEILAQLDLQAEVWEPGLTDDEIPEQVLTVQDSEVSEKEIFLFHPHKYSSLILLISSHCDNERLRALNDMMGGVLEVQKEDILKIDIPPPPFIAKPEHEWNDQEMKLFREYEEKVKELNEEKEKHRRALENEWKKLEASIQETTHNFDETVCKLFERKVNLEMVIYQEELKIVNLIYSLLLDEELDTREAGLQHFFMKKQKENYEIFIVICVSFFYVIKNKKEILHVLCMYTRTPMRKMLPDSANPYGDCSASSEDYKDILTCLMEAMDELDKPEHMPDGLDPSIWERFCQARRNKMESEQLVKWKALKLAEMQAFLQRRMDDDQKITSDIEYISQELIRLQEEKIKFQLDLTFQFLLKQGQVELESTEIPDYTDAILINKSVVEELNCSIMAQGEKKIASMVERKDFSRGIFLLEWEHKKMRMQIEDLKQKARDIAMLPISKDRQLPSKVCLLYYFMYLLYSFGNGQLHKKNMKNRQKRIRELEKCIALKEQANYELSLQLKEMLVSVSERRHISQRISERNAKQRYREILKQKNLRDLIKEQEKQFGILQTEAERLRSRTFPIL
uniref:Cilia- and flagella-associated protein 43 n=1 Tax=Anser cygnoides TaxID=8845 RepID=A0A8B9DJY6_ANSCY